MASYDSQIIGTLNGSSVTQADIDRRNAGIKKEQEGHAAKARAEYALSGPHNMPRSHLPAGITDPAHFERPQWLDDIESRSFLGFALPLDYAPEGVRDARERMGKVHSRLRDLDELCAALVIDYHEQGGDVKAALKAEFFDAKEPGDKAKAIEVKLKATATKYHDALLKRNAAFEALADLFLLVRAETRTSIYEWHDAIVTEQTKLIMETAPALLEFLSRHQPSMGEAVALMGHAQAARELLPKSLDNKQLRNGLKGSVDFGAVSSGFSALATFGEQWPEAGTDEFLTFTAAEFEAKAFEPAFDWEAHDKRSDLIDSVRDNISGPGGRTLTPEQAAGIVDGQVG
ncbi:hypothetical protein [Streptomyces sp. G1]|uniref:hypothetical protein n=1 Tax=Streptomyces sp. G1 TaxID=361572 RepID=UPI00202DE494|nr:hypothetical protein [Streptomyces sp. G1]MCM1967242.1 hypothetical protein [Streptomyces sp. G1]